MLWNSIAKNVSITCIFNQCNLFNSFIYSSLSFIFEFHKKQAFKCRAPNVRLKGILKFLDSGRKSLTLDFGHWTLDAGLWTLDSGHWTLDAGIWTLESGRWTLDPGPWTLNSRCWTLDYGLYTLDAGLWTLDTVVDCCRTESESSF